MAGAALREAGVALDEVACVVVEDVVVDDLTGALARLERHTNPAGNVFTRGMDAAAAWMARTFDKTPDPELTEELQREIRLMKPAGELRQLAHETKARIKDSRVVRKIGDAKDRFDETKVGKQLNGLVLEGDPERVVYSGRALIKLKDGTCLPFDLSVLDRMRSAMLQRMSLLVHLIGLPILIPVVDHAFPALLGAVALVGAKAAAVRGNDAYADALKQTAKKSFVLSVLGPLKYPSMVRDAKDLEALLPEKPAQPEACQDAPEVNAPVRVNWPPTFDSE